MGMPTDVEQIILDEIREARKDIKVILSSGCSKASLHEDQEKRLRSLEYDRARALGYFAALSAGMGALSAWVSKKFFS
jgi:hypothetical protein